MVNQKDVAKLAGVSVMTVSRVINDNGYVKDNTRRRVMDALKQLDYYPNNAARSLNQNRVNIIGVLAPIINGTIEDDPYFTRLMHGIELVLLEHSYDMLISTQRQRRVDNEYRFDYFRTYFERKADGLILLGSGLQHSDLDTINQHGITFCVIGDRPPIDNVDVIDTNNREGIKVILDHLYTLGHRKIGFGGYDGDNFNISERYSGYKEFLEERGLPFRDEYVFCHPNVAESGRHIMYDYDSLSDKPTAIVCSTDNYAIDAMNEAKKRGISIPDDLSISGFDGVSLGRYITPALATMRQPLEKMGRKAAELIMRRLLTSHGSCEKHFFDTEYLPGPSIGPPPENHN